MKKIKVSSPATIANLGPCFDVLGVALKEPFDIMEIELLPNTEEIIIDEIKGFNSAFIPKNKDKNTAGLAASFLLKKIGLSIGVKIKIEKGIRPASGMGSSGASAAGVVYALLKLLDRNINYNLLIEAAAEGEKAAAATAHADNVAAALMGGFVILKSHHPVEYIRIKAPDKLRFAIILPEYELSTSKSRSVLPDALSFKRVVGQIGNCAYLIAAIFKGDLVKIGKAVNSDLIVEPLRSPLIRGFKEVKETALKNGAYGCSISGGGPSIFAICDNQNVDTVIGAMEDKLNGLNIGFKSYKTGPSNDGVKVV
ncbi:MAG: homoserine kinase [Candidatus Odinarchaeia archaeon]